MKTAGLAGPGLDCKASVYSLRQAVWLVCLASLPAVCHCCLSGTSSAFNAVGYSIGGRNPQADLLMLLRLQEAKTRVCTGITQHSMDEQPQEVIASSQMISATTEAPQAAKIGSLPGVCDDSDDIIDISSRSPAQGEKPPVAATHAVEGFPMTRGVSATAGKLPAATSKLAEVSMQEEVKISVATAKAPLLVDSTAEMLTAADSAPPAAADAGGNATLAEAMAESAFSAEAPQGQSAEAPSDPLAPHGIFASDDLISSRAGDLTPPASEAMQRSQVVDPLGSPAGGGHVQGAAKHVQQSPTSPLDWAGQSAGSAGSTPTAPAPDSRQLAGFRSADRSGAYFAPMGAGSPDCLHHISGPFSPYSPDLLRAHLDAALAERRKL